MYWKLALFTCVLGALSTSATSAPEDSCANRSCYGTDTSNYNCQCNSPCVTYGDCCSDKDVYCPTSTTLAPEDSCAGRSCYGDDTANYNCQCNSVCANYGDCCSDKDDYCSSTTTLSPEDSCAGRSCSGSDQSFNCQCNSACVSYGDCCSDKDTYCSSSSTTTTSNPGSCGGKISVSNADIENISYEMWLNDVNAANPSQININPQSKTSSGSNVDVSPQPLFTSVDASVLDQETFVLLQNLQDNYIYMQGVDEIVTSDELQEQSDFLDAFLNTYIGDTLYNFLNSKNQIGCVDRDGFKDILQNIWFGLYSREDGADDTSGFEHSFVGEVKDDQNSVSGFHNWVQFYQQEQVNDANYYGYTLEESPDLMGIHFEWHGYMKPISGFSIGTSPEIELGLYTLCHLTRPNSQCGVKLMDEHGNDVYTKIQTYTWTKTYPPNGYSYVASAYFVT